MSPSPAPPVARPSADWDDAMLAVTLFAVDPVGLGGLAIRSGPGPGRARLTERLDVLLDPAAPRRRAPLGIDDERLLGGLDLAASLAAGRPLVQSGLLAQGDGGVVTLPMAERLETGVAARLAAALDLGEVVLERDGLAARPAARIGLLLLDEGLTAEETPPPALMERLAFHVDLEGLDPSAPASGAVNPAVTLAARRALADVAPAGTAILEAVCATALMLGVASLRAPLLTLRAARAHAALRGAAEVGSEDAAVAARLVLAPRALTAPPSEAANEDTPDGSDHDDPRPKPEPSTRDDQPTPDQPPSEAIDAARAEAERVVEIIRASLPQDLLARIAADRGAARAARARGAGAKARGAKRGRPRGATPGPPRSGARLDLVETLRAAVPWQRLRGAAPPAPGGPSERVRVRASDFRLRRFVQRRESTTIFLVDASGSTAVQRLGEAKGAVELLLAKAYVSRARVALIAFRGETAELLLPPTRSLTRARRRLAELPGGGGTPLAAAFDAGVALARAERSQARTPLLVVLTDGRANIGLGGAPGRAAAEADALAAARRVRAADIDVVFLDTASRPGPDADRYARAMGATYAPLPRPRAENLSGLVDALAPARR